MARCWPDPQIEPCAPLRMAPANCVSSPTRMASSPCAARNASAVALVSRRVLHAGDHAWKRLLEAIDKGDRQRHGGLSGDVVEDDAACIAADAFDDVREPGKQAVLVRPLEIITAAPAAGRLAPKSSASRDCSTASATVVAVTPALSLLASTPPASTAPIIAARSRIPIEKPSPVVPNRVMLSQPWSSTYFA